MATPIAARNARGARDVDVFDLRQHVIDDSASYVRSLFVIRDQRIAGHVETALREGHPSPRPLLQLNPTFESGESLATLVASGEIPPKMPRICAHKDPDGTVRAPVRLHRHQPSRRSPPKQRGRRHERRTG